MRLSKLVVRAILAMSLAPTSGFGQTPLSGPPIRIARTSGHITVDGDLSDEAWRHATRVEQWYETNPGDNVETKVRNVGYLTYDDQAFYAAFEFEDPHPELIRAPYADRDNVPSYTDYGGVILDTRNSGPTAVLLLANPRGIQYDAAVQEPRPADVGHPAVPQLSA